MTSVIWPLGLALASLTLSVEKVCGPQLIMNHLNPSQWRDARLWLLGAFAAPIVLAFPAGAEPAMWVIRDKDSTIYLIGTLHLLRHEMEWNAAKVEKTVAESTELWLEAAEIDEGSMAPIVAQYGMDREKTLSSKLNAKQKEKLAKVAATYSVPLASLEPMQPWLAGVMFSILPLQKAGYDPKRGVDRLLKAQADKEGDKVRGFETAQEQIRFFAELPQAEQIAFLEESLGDAEKGLAQLEKLAKAWIDGDSETLGNILVNELKTKAPVLYEKFLVQRNIAWSKKIVEILTGSGVQQIAVGAGHLAGPDSLQVQLQKRGIKVDRY